MSPYQSNISTARREFKCKNSMAAQYCAAEAFPLIYFNIKCTHKVVAYVIGVFRMEMSILKKILRC
jgi:hypothetical protein